MVSLNCGTAHACPLGLSVPNCKMDLLSHGPDGREVVGPSDEHAMSYSGCALECGGVGCSQPSLGGWDEAVSSQRRGPWTVLQGLHLGRGGVDQL